MVAGGGATPPGVLLASVASAPFHPEGMAASGVESFLLGQEQVPVVDEGEVFPAAPSAIEKGLCSNDSSSGVGLGSGGPGRKARVDDYNHLFPGRGLVKAKDPRGPHGSPPGEVDY